MDVNGKVAVVTGAASGMGFAMAETFGGAGMKVVLADIEEAALEQATAQLVQAGYEAIGVRTVDQCPTNIKMPESFTKSIREWQ